MSMLENGSPRIWGSNSAVTKQFTPRIPGKGLKFSTDSVVDSAGFEPAASALRRQRSYQLSYEPLFSLDYAEYNIKVPTDKHQEQSRALL